MISGPIPEGSPILIAIIGLFFIGITVFKIIIYKFKLLPTF